LLPRANNHLYYILSTSGHPCVPIQQFLPNNSSFDTGDQAICPACIINQIVEVRSPETATGPFFAIRNRAKSPCRAFWCNGSSPIWIAKSGFPYLLFHSHFGRTTKLCPLLISNTVWQHVLICWKKLQVLLLFPPFPSRAFLTVNRSQDVAREKTASHDINRKQRSQVTIHQKSMSHMFLKTGYSQASQSHSWRPNKLVPIALLKPSLWSGTKAYHVAIWPQAQADHIKIHHVT
jgi:hypothetical protein